MHLTAKLVCPHCGDFLSRVVDSRCSTHGDTIWRRRKCCTCAKKFTTRELVLSLPKHASTTIDSR